MCGLISLALPNRHLNGSRPEEEHKRVNPEVIAHSPADKPKEVIHALVVDKHVSTAGSE
jgi:hypothetical protein